MWPAICATELWNDRPLAAGKQVGPTSDSLFGRCRCRTDGWALACAHNHC